MIRVAGYCRVSTDKDDQANSFEAQQRYFREFIRNQPDWELYRIYADEGITGTSTKKRFQFNRMLRDGYEGKFQLIITKEVSRFSRNILDTIYHTRELKAAGIGVVFLTDGISTLDTDAELRLSIMASIAQEESRRTSTRVVWGQTRQMERGVVFGRSLLGYDVKDGKISVNPEGAEVVRMIFQKYALEQVSAAQIAAYLTRAGYETSRGSTQWHASTIIKILKNEKYTGDLIQRKSYTPDFLTHEKKRNTGQQPLIMISDHHSPIISRELWEKAQVRLTQNNKHGSSKNGHSNRYPLSGKIRCGECGAVFVGRIRMRKDGTSVRRWSCSTVVRDGRGSCGIGKLLRDDDGINMVKVAMGNLNLDREQIISHISALIRDAALAGKGYDPENLLREITRTEHKKHAMLDSFFAGEISREDMLAMKEKYESQIKNLRSRSHGRSISDSGENIKEYLLSILRGNKESEILYKMILREITVFKDKHMELRMHHLPHVFHFREETGNRKQKNEPHPVCSGVSKEKKPNK